MARESIAYDQGHRVRSRESLAFISAMMFRSDGRDCVTDLRRLPSNSNSSPDHERSGWCYLRPILGSICEREQVQVQRRPSRRR